MVALVLVLSGSSAAQETSPAEEGWGDEKTVGVRSKAPARGDSYNWRQMAVAGVVVLCVAGGLVLLIRRHTRGRDRG